MPLLPPECVKMFTLHRDATQKLDRRRKTMAWLNDGGNSHHLTDIPGCRIAHLHNHFKTTFRIKKHLNIFSKKVLYVARLGCLWFVCLSHVVRCDWQRLAPMVCVECRPHFLPVQSLLIWLSPSHQGCRHHAVLGGWGWFFCLPSLLLGVGEKNLFSILFPLSPNLSHHHPWLRISQWKGRKGASPVNTHSEKWEKELGFGGQIAPAQPTWWSWNHKRLSFNIWKATECPLPCPFLLLWGWYGCSANHTSYT